LQRFRGKRQLNVKVGPLEEFSLAAAAYDLDVDVGLLAGVLLGKTSLNSLYGLMGEPPRTEPQVGDADSAGIWVCGAAE
jgi:hypothetical protein